MHYCSRYKYDFTCNANARNIIHTRDNFGAVLQNDSEVTVRLLAYLFLSALALELFTLE